MGDFNPDELVAPSWLNEQFFEEVLRKNENDKSVKVRELKITPGSGKGDHYASVLFRATITYDTSKSKAKLISMIVKIMPETDGHKKEMLSESFIFETEIAMYTKAIPQLESELRKIGDDTVLGAKCLYGTLEPRKCIIFEDIVPKGYETLRNRAADMDEAKAALLKLAKWHAVSYKLAAEGDKSITSYKDSFITMKDFDNQDFVKDAMDNFIDKINTIDDLKQYVPHLRHLQKDVVQRCVQSAKSFTDESHEGKIFVLCHGDFHAKNMMFKRNADGGLDDVMLLDFQACYFGPPAMDVIYSIYLLLNEDLRKNHRDEMIYYYSSNFIETLKRLKFFGTYPKVADFYIDILRHRHWEVFLLSGFLPIWSDMLFGSKDLDNMMTSNDARRRVYDNPEFIKEVRRILPIMLHKGYFE